MDSDFAQKRSKKPLIIIAGVVVALIVVGIAVGAALGGGNDKKPLSTASTTTTKQESVATNEQVAQSLKNLDSSVKQAATYQSTAKSSLTDTDKQIKVGN